MANALALKRLGLRALDFTIAQPLRAAWQYGSQAAITSASVSLNATFAMSHGILTPGFAWAQAIGFEWTYLRGLATAGQTKSRWVDALNIIAFASVILYGVMACLVTYKVIPPAPVPALAAVLALIHIVPIGLTGLCSAMIHRVVAEQGRQRAEQDATAERTRQSRIQAEQDQLAIENARKAAELASWEAGQRAQLAIETERMRAKMQLKMHTHDAPAKMRRDARPARMDAERGKCPKCGAALSHAQWLAACRWEHCSNCKGQP